MGGRGNTFIFRVTTVYFIVWTAKSLSVTSLTDCCEFCALQHPTSTRSGGWAGLPGWICGSSSDSTQRLCGLQPLSMEQTAGLYHVWPHHCKNWPLCKTSAVCPDSWARTHFCESGLSSSKIAFLLPLPSANSFSDKAGVIRTSSGAPTAYAWVS